MNNPSAPESISAATSTNVFLNPSFIGMWNDLLPGMTGIRVFIQRLEMLVLGSSY